MASTLRPRPRRRIASAARGVIVNLAGSLAVDGACAGRAASRAVGAADIACAADLPLTYCGGGSPGTCPSAAPPPPPRSPPLTALLAALPPPPPFAAAAAAADPSIGADAARAKPGGSCGPYTAAALAPAGVAGAAGCEPPTPAPAASAAGGGGGGSLGRFMLWRV